MADIVFSSPHIIAELLSTKEQKCNLVLLGINGNLNQNIWQADLVIGIYGFNVSKRLGRIRRKCYHIGCKTVTITMRIENGIITSHDNDETIKTNNTHRTKITDKQNSSLQPTLETADVKFGPGKIDQEEGIEKEFTTAFEYQEKGNTIIGVPNSVTWRIEQPKTPMLMRDYLLGSYPFKTTINWHNDIKTGSIELAPLDIDIFNEKNEAISGFKAVYFEYLLWLKKINILNKKGVEFKFQIND